MHEADRGLSVRFFMFPQQNPRRSKEEGRPIFEDIEMVSIMAPGNTKTERVAPASEIHFNSNISAQQTYIERFPEQYDAFKRNAEEQTIGTPLAELTFLTAAKREELRSQKIHTVEQLAHVSDTNIRRLGHGFRELVDGAIAYLAKSTDNAAMMAEMDEMRREIAELRAAKEAQDDNQDSNVGNDPYGQYTDDQIKDMIRDAGGEVPRGKAGRAKLIEALESIGEAA